MKKWKRFKMANQTQERLQIAHTIRQQLLNGGPLAVLSWGAHNWFSLPKERGFLGGLRFSVEGKQYQGPINVRLAGNDTYTLEIGAMTYHDVGCEQLTNIIDACVETGDD
jgi:hypothetical protein